MQTIFLNGAKHLVLNRRKFLGVAGGLIAAGVLPKNVMALAGPYSFKQGAYDVTVVSDGTLLLPVSLIGPSDQAAEVKKLLGTVLQGETMHFEASPLLLKSATDTILVDTGYGVGPAPTAGKLAESLMATGTDPASITKVIYTHAHPDHLWGTIGADGKSSYINASFHMSETEFNFWAAPDLASKMPKEMEGMVNGTAAKLAAIKEKLALFKTGVELLPGINVLDSAGHTPGHVSFELSGGDGMIIMGDAVPNPNVFFAHPDFTITFDAVPEMAIVARKKLLDMASAKKMKMIGYHWPYPGIGMAEAKDGAYIYVPAV